MLSVLHRLSQSKTKWKYYTYSTKSPWGSIVHTSRQTTHDNTRVHRVKQRAKPPRFLVNWEDSIAVLVERASSTLLTLLTPVTLLAEELPWPWLLRGMRMSAECVSRFAPSWFVEKILMQKRGKRQAESREMLSEHHCFPWLHWAIRSLQHDAANAAILAEAFPTSRHAWRQIFLLLLGTWMALCGGSLYAFSRWLEVIPFASNWMQSTPMQCNFFMLYIWYIVWNLVSSGCSSSWQVRGANHEPLQPLCATFGCHICSWPGA